MKNNEENLITSKKKVEKNYNKIPNIKDSKTENKMELLQNLTMLFSPKFQGIIYRTCCICLCSYGYGYT